MLVFTRLLNEKVENNIQNELLLQRYAQPLQCSNIHWNASLKCNAVFVYCLIYYNVLSGAMFTRCTHLSTDSYTKWSESMNHHNCTWTEANLSRTKAFSMHWHLLGTSVTYIYMRYCIFAHSTFQYNLVQLNSVRLSVGFVFGLPSDMHTYAWITSLPSAICQTNHVRLNFHSTILITWSHQ